MGKWQRQAEKMALMGDSNWLLPFHRFGLANSLHDKDKLIVQNKGWMKQAIFLKFVIENLTSMIAKSNYTIKC